MSNLQEMLAEKAYDFAKGNDPYRANKMIDTLVSLGMVEEEIEAIRREVGITYLKQCKDPVKFGVVESFYLRHATVDAYDKGEDTQYIGLSPYGHYRFLTYAPFYSKKYGRKEVLSQLARDWYYINIPKDESKAPYGGLVVSAYRGEYWVLPFFDLEQIKALAEKHIRNLGDADSHAWESPENFTKEFSEYEHLYKLHTALALEHYGLL